VCPTGRAIKREGDHNSGTGVPLERQSSGGNSPAVSPGPAKLSVLAVGETLGFGRKLNFVGGVTGPREIHGELAHFLDQSRAPQVEEPSRLRDRAP